MRLKQNQGRLTLELIGWVVFTASACGFLVSSFLARDLFAMAGSLLFLVGCLLFLAPLLRWQRHGPLHQHDACKHEKSETNERSA